MSRLTVADAARLADEVSPSPARAAEALQVLREALIFALSGGLGARDAAWWEQALEISRVLELPAAGNIALQAGHSPEVIELVDAVRAVASQNVSVAGGRAWLPMTSQQLARIRSALTHF